MYKDGQEKEDFGQRTQGFLQVAAFDLGKYTSEAGKGNSISTEWSRSEG